MWFLLRKNTYKRFIVWSKLGSLVSLLHVVFLFLLFCVGNNNIEHLSLVITPEMLHRDIEFRVAIEKIKKPVSLPKKVVKTKTPPAIVKETTLAATKKEELVEKVPAVKQKEKQSIKNEPMQTQQAPVVAQKIEPEHLEVQCNANPTAPGCHEGYKLLYEEIVSHWSPPPGIPAQCTCIITVMVDKTGNVEQMNLDSSSGMLIYDVAARAALSELQFPRLAWGKSITITFTI